MDAVSRRLSRRTFILGSAAAAGAVALPFGALSASAATVTPYPFTLGIASGDPAPDSVVLWTRLAPSPTNADGQGGMPNADVEVDWQVSTTDTFATLVASGSVTAHYAAAHSVHVVAGGLASDADYFYRFRAQGYISPVGRTRTAPAFTAVGRDLVMAFASCSNYEAGYYTAYRRMADDEPDLILHLGDYIYEGAASTGKPRAHLGAECVSLADYRRRYAQYKTDPGPAGRTCGRTVAGRAGRPRGREQLRRHGTSGQQPGAHHGTVDRPAYRGVPGVLREHAAAADVHAERQQHPALPSGPVGHAGDVPHARHPAVP